MLPGQRLASPQEAIRFVNERGFVFLWPIKNVTLPSLWTAVAGNRPVADEHDDPGHITWSWKDSLLDKRVWYYGRVLKHKNTFVSLDTIPYFYALTPNYGDPEEDFLDQYRQGLLTLETKLVFEALLKEGPLDTLSLRKAAHLTGKTSDSAFNRALDTLQMQCKCLPVAISEAGRWGYAFVYDLTHRYYPDLAENARFISENKARQVLAHKYLASVGAASLKEISRLFIWPPELTLRALKSLVQAEEILEDVILENEKEPVFAIKSLSLE